jgi:hypothetical protein
MNTSFDDKYFQVAKERIEATEPKTEESETS